MTEPLATEDVVVRAVDGTHLAGRLFVPTRPRPLAVLISHGTAGAFNTRVAGWFGEHFAPQGFTTLALNRRDHDDQNCGTTFEDGLEDLRVGIDLLEERGYEHVYLCGHSKGTLYLGRYVRETADPRVAALGLYGAVDDNYITAKDVLMRGTYEANLELAQTRIRGGRADEPVDFGSAFGMAIQLTARGFVSYFGPETHARPVDDIPRLQIPSLLCWASTDELTPEPMHLAILEAARKAGAAVEFLRIEDTDPAHTAGDGHAYVGLEAEVTAGTVEWLERLLPALCQRPA